MTQASAPRLVRAAPAHWPSRATDPPTTPFSDTPAAAATVATPAPTCVTLISVPISKGAVAAAGMVTVTAEDPVVSRMQPPSTKARVWLVAVRVRSCTTPGRGTSSQTPAAKRTKRASSVIQTCQPSCGGEKHPGRDARHLIPKRQGIGIRAQPQRGRSRSGRCCRSRAGPRCARWRAAAPGPRAGAGPR